MSGELRGESGLCETDCCVLEKRRDECKEPEACAHSFHLPSFKLITLFTRLGLPSSRRPKTAPQSYRSPSLL
jgi:hypothetical protein